MSSSSRPHTLGVPLLASLWLLLLAFRLVWRLAVPERIAGLMDTRATILRTLAELGGCFLLPAAVLLIVSLIVARTRTTDWRGPFFRASFFLLCALLLIFGTLTALEVIADVGLWIETGGGL